MVPAPRLIARPAARSLTFAAVVVPAGALAHLLGGGAAPAPLPLLAAGVAAAAIHRASLARRETGWAVLALVLGVVQVLVHLLLRAAEPHAGHVMAGHPGTVPMTTSVLAPMLAAHVAAVLALALLLRAGERISWSTARRLAGRVLHLAVLLCRPFPAPRRPLVSACRAGVQACPRSVRRLRLTWTAGRIRRGPPLLQPC